VLSHSNFNVFLFCQTALFHKCLCPVIYFLLTRKQLVKPNHDMKYVSHERDVIMISLPESVIYGTEKLTCLKDFGIHTVGGGV
jgi:hypothetical protein